MEDLASNTWFTVEENPEKKLVLTEYVKLLGYKWNSEQDILYPGFAELNLNKKVRVAKKSNVLPVVTLADAGEW